ncbi:MAG TPA: hypothetical protein VFP44_14485 [Usitatibacter sp.]|nr:hypothetical protein [Usitatibacter sp.]
MKRTIRALAFACAAAVAGTAGAAMSFSNDVTDLWWNADESGWGVNIIQQSNILFATFFVYDQNGQPHWFVASDLEGASVPTDIPYRFTGRLYETTGPAFSAAAFSASAVTRRDAGPATFEFFPPNTGRLTYSVDGVTVTKNLNRQTWAANDMSGKYFGGRMTIKSPFNAATCSPSTGLQVFDDITITHSGTSFTMTAVAGAAPPSELCNYTGTYSQAGHMGRVEGAYSCQSGVSGSFTLGEVEIGTNGFSAFYDASDQAGCRGYGNFSAVRTN